MIYQAALVEPSWALVAVITMLALIINEHWNIYLHFRVH